MIFLNSIKWKIRKYHYRYLFPKDRVFIHIPKTGGISYYNSKYYISLGHFSIFEFQHFTNLNFKDYLAIVRDPVDRFISSINHLKSNGGSDSKFNDKILRTELINLNIDEILNFFESKVEDLNKLDPIFKEQSFYLVNKNPVESLKLYNFKTFKFKKKTNVSKNSYNFNLTNDLKQRIRHLYKKDFSLYNKLESKNSIKIKLE
jgi:hypothetical protein